MDADTALRLAGSDPDYHVKDLFNAIERKDYPIWSVFLQVMTPEEAKVAPIDIFDDTYTWPHAKYPLRLVGRLSLNKNVGYPSKHRIDDRLTSCSRTTTFKT